MKTFIQGNNLSKIVKAVLFMILGVALIVTKANAMTMAVQILAAGICVFGVFSLVMGLRFTAAIPVNSIMSILIATLVFYFAGPISAVLRYIFGGLLCLFGVSQTLKLFSMRSMFGGSFIPFIVPVFAMLLGALFFSEELIGNDIMGLIVGILFILYGASTLLMILKFNKLMAQVNPENISRGSSQSAAKKSDGWYKVDNQDVKDVDYEKVD